MSLKEIVLEGLKKELESDHRGLYHLVRIQVPNYGGRVVLFAQVSDVTPELANVTYEEHASVFVDVGTGFTDDEIETVLEDTFGPADDLKDKYNQSIRIRTRRFLVNALEVA